MGLCGLAIYIYSASTVNWWWAFSLAHTVPMAISYIHVLT